VTDIPESSDTTFDSARFRQVLGHFPTGVTVITTIHDGAPVGLAVGSFASLSLEPPLVMFGAGRQSSTWPKIREAGTFAINLLAEDQEDICRVFASKATDKFAEIGWRKGANGAPIIDGVLGFIECELHQVVEAGDHELAIGRVTALDVVHEGGPLLFYRGGYGRFGA
jgi:3-hydroxy-9,10-secoandrosta-1,3,5(10)-triene-9,17-dione monooxygenase reductase component